MDVSGSDGKPLREYLQRLAVAAAVGVFARSGLVVFVLLGGGVSFCGVFFMIAVIILCL